MAPHRDNPANRCHQYCAGCCERGPSRPVNLIGAEAVFPLHLLGVMPRKPFLRKTFGHCLRSKAWYQARFCTASADAHSDVSYGKRASPIAAPLLTLSIAVMVVVLASF